MLALDTETTGLDFRHGAKPFYATIATDRGELYYWEWHVNPRSRQPDVPSRDLDEIEELVMEEAKTSYVVLQNSKFDIAALRTLRPRIAERWPWSKTRDTLYSGHLLASLLPHDLTSMTLQYLGRNIQPFEDRLQ